MMKDLGEHIGAILWLFAGVLAICGIFIGIIWRDLRKAISDAKGEGRKFTSWLQEQTNKGGVVTRDDHFGFCGQERAKCPILKLDAWRNELYEKGGMITMTEHTAICKEERSQVIDIFCRELTHSRELMLKELQLIQATIKNDVVEEIRALKNAQERNGK